MSWKVNSFVDSKALKEKKDGIIPFIITSKTVDRDSEVVMPDGGDFSNFKSNPVFVWVHDIYEKPPIGKVLVDTLKVIGDFLMADVEFDLEDPFAALIYHKYKKGFLNAGSLRFRAKEIGNPILPGQKGATIKKWEMIEFSAVPVPANPEALASEMKSFKDELKKYSAIKTFYEEVKTFNSIDDWIKMMPENKFSISKVMIKESTMTSKSFVFISETKRTIPNDATLYDYMTDEYIEHPKAGEEVTEKTLIFLPQLITSKRIFYQLTYFDNDSDLKTLIEQRLKDVNIIAEISVEDQVLTLDAVKSFDFQEYFKNSNNLITDDDRKKAITKKMNNVLNSDLNGENNLLYLNYKKLKSLYEKLGIENPPAFRINGEKLIDPKEDKEKSVDNKDVNILKVAGEVAKILIEEHLKGENNE